jgi:hypothetical protein
MLLQRAKGPCYHLHIMVSAKKNGSSCMPWFIPGPRLCTKTAVLNAGGVEKRVSSHYFSPTGFKDAHAVFIPYPKMVFNRLLFEKEKSPAQHCL